MRVPTYDSRWGRAANKLANKHILPSTCPTCGREAKQDKAQEMAQALATANLPLTSLCCSGRAKCWLAAKTAWARRHTHILTQQKIARDGNRPPAHTCTTISSKETGLSWNELS